ncbi:MAG: hypothetical protein NC113_03710 [Bacteroides sp.]|nr:hypothetical protein [Bacteroides sp.]
MSISNLARGTHMARPSLLSNKAQFTFIPPSCPSMLRTIHSNIIVAIACACLLTSCNGLDRNAPTTVDANDSTALRIALLPIKECEPLRYAKETGLAKNMGLDIVLIEYDAMMDMDTAVLSDVAHVYFEDSMRINNIKADSIRPAMLVPIPVKMSIVANKEKGIEKLTALNTHMVGLTRTSALERWMNELTDTSNLEQDEVYHAQINSIPVRFRMLSDGLIDAAIMPRPWCDSLATLGHTIIEEEILEGMGFFVSAKANTDSTLRLQAELLKKVYLEAMTRTEK